MPQLSPTFGVMIFTITLISYFTMMLLMSFKSKPILSGSSQKSLVVGAAGNTHKTSKLNTIYFY